MYKEYWGLTEDPFENTPNPKFLYHSKEHEEALFRLLYVVEQKKGAAMLTGVFGCGKTVIGRTLLSKLNKNIYRVAFITNPYLKSVELLRSIARQLGVTELSENLNEMSADAFLQRIEEVLINNSQDGKETLIVIDEAHMVKDDDIFEELRLLLNFQTEDKFLLTLILMGQSELQEKVRKHKPFAQRVALGYHLAPFDQQDTQNYIEHRLAVAGAKNVYLFTPQAIESVFQNSGGIPRRINQICDMCLLAGYNNNAAQVDQKIAEDVVSSLGV
jgi:type II secretory pathway predicted ATPase ExeA